MFFSLFCIFEVTFQGFSRLYSRKDFQKAPENLQMNRYEFEQMAPPLRKRIVSMVRSMSADADSDLADDVAQDTLLKLWTVRDKLDEYRSVESLAMVIARHRAIDILRDHGFGETVGLEAVGAHGSTPSPEESMIASESHDGILAVIASLPSVQQSVIRMKHIEGLEISEIARITGSSEGSIRVALSRARQSIKEIFMQQQI